MSTLSAYINASDLLKIINLPASFLHKKLRITIEDISEENSNKHKALLLGGMAKFSKIKADIISPLDNTWEVLKS